MPETHILQNVIPFAVALWWTKHWLFNRLVARWRHLVAGLSGAILWIYIAYSSTAVREASSGVVIEYQNMALAYFSAFMVVVSLIGILLGFVMWTEEKVEETGENAPQALRSNLGDD